MKRILECVPNFSEGRDPNIIRAITARAEGIENVKVLDVDPGASTNRTVITIAGEPEAVIEAAYRMIQAAAELIDMRVHKGEHPRMGATDVCPLVPISGITVEEAVVLAHKLAKRVGETLGIPVYLYEYAAMEPHRKSLADIRAGEYEGFRQKIHHPQWKPDYGPTQFNEKSGQTVIGVREILVAYNVNLNTQSVRRANSVAFDVREAGRVQTDANGKTLKGADGNPIRIPGKLKHVRAIGWYIDEFGRAQVSINLTNIRETPLHVVFDEVEKSAIGRGMRVTGSELVGLVPKSCLVDAGKFFLRKQGRTTSLPEKELIDIAVLSLGLAELRPFEPSKKIIDYLLADPSPSLTDKTVTAFCHAVSSESPAPGGGTVSAVVGALGASLGAMVANLSGNKKGWEAKQETFSAIGEALQQTLAALLQAADEDTAAFNQVMNAFKMPNTTSEQAAARTQAIQEATLYAAKVPLGVMQTCMLAYPQLEQLVTTGNPNSITDAGVGVLCLHAAVVGAGMNVQINLQGLKDEKAKAQFKTEADALIAQSAGASARLTEAVFKAITK
jgi:glutamate formiminotransferase/formiminotetrahydrofolate cyclodeaminase